MIWKTSHINCVFNRYLTREVSRDSHSVSQESPRQTGRQLPRLLLMLLRPLVLHRKQLTHLRWQCFMVNAESVVQVTALS